MIDSCPKPATGLTPGGGFLHVWNVPAFVLCSFKRVASPEHAVPPALSASPRKDREHSCWALFGGVAGKPWRAAATNFLPFNNNR